MNRDRLLRDLALAEEIGEAQVADTAFTRLPLEPVYFDQPLVEQLRGAPYMIRVDVRMVRPLTERVVPTMKDRFLWLARHVLAASFPSAGPMVQEFDEFTVAEQMMDWWGRRAQRLRDGLEGE